MEHRRKQPEISGIRVKLSPLAYERYWQLKKVKPNVTFQSLLEQAIEDERCHPLRTFAQQLKRFLKSSYVEQQVAKRNELGIMLLAFRETALYWMQKIGQLVKSSPPE